MKLSFFLCLFLVPSLIEGDPDDNEQWLQPRGITDIIGWLYYGSGTNKPLEESGIAKDDPTKLAPTDKAKTKDEPVEVNFLKEWKEENSDQPKLEETDSARVIPIDELGPNDEPEPIENLLEHLKQETNETSEEEKKNSMGLLMDLKTTMKDTSTNLAKVLINKTWHIFDIGTLGSTRRTRNANETDNILLTFYYALFGWLHQILSGGLHLGGNNVLGNARLGNNVQGGGLFNLLFPFYSSNGSLNQNVLGAVAGLPGGKKNNSGKNLYYIIVNDDNKKRANALLNGKTTNDIILKIKNYLNKESLSTEEKFYIILKLQDLFENLSHKNDETVLELINLIFEIGDDGRFDQLFKIFKSKKNEDFDEIWELFKKKPKLNEKYITIIRNLPDKKIVEHPSRDCFIINNDDEDDDDDDSDSDSDDDLTDKIDKEHTRKSKKKVETYVLQTRGTKSKKNIYICCIDDDDELKADRILDGKTKDETIDIIRKKIDKDDHDLDTEYRWYIILKLYTMLKEIENDEKDHDEKGKEDKEKIINLIILIGKKPKFKELLEGLESKKDPRFREIKKLLKNEPREPGDIVKSPKKEHDPEISSSGNIKDEKGEKHEADPPQQIVNKMPPDVFNIDFSTWKNDFDPILRDIEMKMKNPNLDLLSRWKIIDFIDKWYTSDSIDPKVKSKFDGLRENIKQDPNYDPVFKKIKEDNDPPVIKRVFDLFGKKLENPPNESYQRISSPPNPAIQDGRIVWPWHQTITKSTRYYSGYDRATTQQNSDDDIVARLPLIDKTDTLINRFALDDNNPNFAYQDPISAQHMQNLKQKAIETINNYRDEFNTLEDGILSEITKPPDFLVDMLREFKRYLIRTDYAAVGKKYTRGEERKKMEDFIYLQKSLGVKLTKD